MDIFKCRESSGHYANQWKIGTEKTEVFHICFDFFFKSSLYFKLLNGMHFVKHSSRRFYLLHKAIELYARSYMSRALQSCVSEISAKSDRRS